MALDVGFYRPKSVYLYVMHSKAMEDSDLDGEEDDESDEGEEKTTDAQNGGPPKRKLEMSEYPEIMAKRFANFEPYRNNTLQKWYDKTRLTMGKTTKVRPRGFFCQQK